MCRLSCITCKAVKKNLENINNEVCFTTLFCVKSCYSLRQSYVLLVALLHATYKILKFQIIS